jgi:hypothetical protein
MMGGGGGQGQGQGQGQGRGEDKILKVWGQVGER